MPILSLFDIKFTFNVKRIIKSIYYTFLQHFYLFLWTKINGFLTISLIIIIIITRVLHTSI